MRTPGLIALFFVLPGCGVPAAWRALRENAAGVRAIRAENPAAATEHFANALADAPFEPGVHANLGLSLDAQKRSEEAIKSYTIAEAMARTDGERFLTRFNLGELYGRAKKIDEALAWYQKALEAKPDSIETKTNIELLTKQQQGQGGEGDQQKQDQQQQGKGDQKKDSKDQEGDKDKDKKDEPKDGEEKKQYGQTPKYQPRPFKGDLSEAEVKKILGEIRQQEQKIRAEFNRKEAKERPRDKDW